MLQSIKAAIHRGSDYFGRKKSLRAQSLAQSLIQNELLSDSQKTRFELSVISIVEHPQQYRKFRNIYEFRSIVETVSYQQGLAYIKRISQLQSDFALNFDAYRRNETIGSPVTYRYPHFGKISPTTLRYVSVALEIRNIFGSNLSGNFVEIGAGYGGQASILCEFFNMEGYDIYDLPSAQELTKKYLTGLAKSEKVRMLSLTSNLSENWDFAMSNYAFSELPSELQKRYIQEVLGRAKKGYLIMNSGCTNITGRSEGKLSLQELRTLLPAFEVVEEKPLTGPDNYIIMWGHK